MICLVSPGLLEIHVMITITQPQIEAICLAAERYVRSLRRSNDDHEDEIKEIQGWIEALKNEKCQLSFLLLANLLKMYPIKQLDINFTSDSDYTKLESIIQLVAQQTKTLDRMILHVQDVHFTPGDFSGLDKLVNCLRVFKRIDHFEFNDYRASMEVFELIAGLPIISFCVRNECYPCSLGKFIRTNKTIEHLELFSYHTLKVSDFSHLKVNLIHIPVIKN